MMLNEYNNESRFSLSQFISHLMIKIAEKIAVDSTPEYHIIHQCTQLIHKALIRILHPDRNKKTNLSADIALAKISAKELANFLGLPVDDVAHELTKLKINQLEYSFNSQSINKLLVDKLQEFYQYEPKILSQQRDKEITVANTYLHCSPKMMISSANNESNIDILIRSENAIYQLPGGFELYASWHWLPPENFIELIMKGGLFSLAVRTWAGVGGYKHNLHVSKELMNKVLRNTAFNRTYFSYSADHYAQNKTIYYAIERIGYLFGITTSDSIEAMIDAHSFEEEIDKGFGKLARFGQLSQRGQFIAHNDFWDRVKLLVDCVSIKKNQYARLSKNEKFPILVHLSPYQVNEPTVVTVNPCATFKANWRQLIPSVSILDLLRNSTKAKAIEILDYKNKLVQFEFKKVNDTKEVIAVVERFASFCQEKYGTCANFYHFKHDEQNKILYFYVKDNLKKYHKYYYSTPFSIAELEIEFGKPGKMIPKILRSAKYCLKYSSIEEVEKAIEILLKNKIIDAFAILVRGFSIFFTEEVRQENLAKMAEQIELQAHYLTYSESPNDFSIKTNESEFKLSKQFNYQDKDDVLRSLHYFFNELMPDFCFSWLKITNHSQALIKLSLDNTYEDELSNLKAKQLSLEFFRAIKIIVRWSGIETRLVAAKRYIRHNYSAWSAIDVSETDEVSFYIPRSAIEEFNNTVFNGHENKPLLTHLSHYLELMKTLDPTKDRPAQSLILVNNKELLPQPENPLILKNTLMTNSHQTIFYNAVESQDLFLVQRYLGEGEGTDLDTAIFQAIRLNNSALLALLLKHGANANACNPKNEKFPGTALHCAAYYQNSQAIQLLLASGACPNQFRSFTCELDDNTVYATPLIVAVLQKNIECITLLSNKKIAQIFIVDKKRNRQHFDFFVKNQSPQVVNLLRKKLLTTAYGHHWVHSIEELDQLIQAIEATGTNLSMAFKQQLQQLCLWTELDEIITLEQSIDKEIFTILLNNPYVNSETLAEKDFNGENLIMRAIAHGKEQFIDALLDCQKFSHKTLLAITNKNGLSITELIAQKFGNNSDLTQKSKSLSEELLPLSKRTNNPTLSTQGPITLFFQTKKNIINSIDSRSPQL